MTRKLALIVLPLLLVLAACNGGGGNDSSKTHDGDTPDTVARGDSAESEGRANPFLAFNPFSVLGSLGSASSASGAQSGDDLASALLTIDDLPEGYSDLGSFNYNLPSSAGGGQMSASMFMSGDVANGQLNVMVMSMAMALPPDALEEMEGFEMGQEDLDEAERLADQSGVDFSDLRVLDASGLGDGRFGMRMTMAFDGLLGGLGVSSADNTFEDGLTMEMYGFLDGEQMRMLMVMSPAGQSTGVDARDLAEAMDAK